MSMKIKIAICEDEKSERTYLKYLLGEYLDKHELCAEIVEFTSGEAFLESDVSEYSLVFLDIYLGKLNGMDTAKQLLKRNSRVEVIFCSSSKEFAVESYEVSALYYLVKPVDKEKLSGALDRFFDGIRKLKTIPVKVGRSEEYVFLNDIIWAEAHNKKTILHLKDGEMEVSMPFSYFGEALKEPDFVKVIRYAIVSVGKVKGVPLEKAELTDGTVLPISRGERQHVRDVFAEFKWKAVF